MILIDSHTKQKNDVSNLMRCDSFVCVAQMGRNHEKAGETLAQTISLHHQKVTQGREGIDEQGGIVTGPFLI